MGRSGGFLSGLLIWRNTSAPSLGPGQTVTLAPEALGLADIGVQPATRQPGLFAATASTDGPPPSAAIVTPADGAVVASGGTVAISGTAADAGGGVVGGVEVSVDRGRRGIPPTAGPRAPNRGPSRCNDEGARRAAVRRRDGRGAHQGRAALLR